jgi:hypothetical protein
VALSRWFQPGRYGREAWLDNRMSGAPLTGARTIPASIGTNASAGSVETPDPARCHTWTTRTRSATSLRCRFGLPNAPVNDPRPGLGQMTTWNPGRASRLALRDFPPSGVRFARLPPGTALGLPDSSFHGVIAIGARHCLITAVAAGIMPSSVKEGGEPCRHGKTPREGTRGPTQKSDHWPGPDPYLMLCRG